MNPLRRLTRWWRAHRPVIVPKARIDKLEHLCTVQSRELQKRATEIDRMKAGLTERNHYINDLLTIKRRMQREKSDLQTENLLLRQGKEPTNGRHTDQT